MKSRGMNLVTWLGDRLGRFKNGPAVCAEGDLPLRGELFSLAQLEEHGRVVAGRHVISPRPGRERLLRRLRENERIIRESHDVITEAIRLKRSVSPAAEWLLDNYYLVEDQIALAREHLPTAYSRELPRLESGPARDLPRVYDLTQELVEHTDGRVDVENLRQFVKAYQDVTPLNLGELWAVPIMLRLALVDNLRRVAYRLAWRRRQRDYAVEWAERFLEIARTQPRNFVTVLADFVRSGVALSAPVIAELAANLEGQHHVLGLAIEWLEQELAERGQSIELVRQAERHDQAADQVSISNTVGSLRGMAGIDWHEFVESLSSTEAILRKDPAGFYPRMDFRSRDAYRHVVERLSKRSGQREEHVAQAAVRLASSGYSAAGDAPEHGHIGYYLVGDGCEKLEQELGGRPPILSRAGRALRPGAWGVYLTAVLVFTALMALPLLAQFFLSQQSVLLRLLAVVVTSLVAARPAIAIINWAFTLIVPPRSLPRLDFKDGLPQEHRTAVVVPALLTSANAIDELLEHLEVRSLANRSSNLFFGLLTDFPDADQEVLPSDERLIERAVEGIRRLNERYAQRNGTVFFLMHRPRIWDERESVWMAYERKRGKLSQFNRFVREGYLEPFTVIEGDLEPLRSVRYVITLDADTQLPPGAAWKMVGTIAHPLNRPRNNRATGCVEVGYGVLQPRLVVNLTSAQRSWFASIFAGEVGLDPYTREVSNLYHDLFGTGQFVGKGIYDVAAFDTALRARFPENRVLSHDLIEGCHARCGFMNDVELIEEHPSSYLLDMRRRHRWVRGDWQIARWLFRWVPTATGGRSRNPLTGLARWMILDNLRRSLTPAAVLAAFALGWLAVSHGALRWTLQLLLVLFLPQAARACRRLLQKERRIAWHPHLLNWLAGERRAWAEQFLDLSTLPFQAATYLDAAGRSVWRLCVTHRGLLKWTTAAAAERAARSNLWHTVCTMWTAPVSALGVAAAVGLRWQFQAHPGLVVPIIWFAAPLLAWAVSRTRISRPPALSEVERQFLRRLARRTWMYFEAFVNPEHNWLPPDSFQEPGEGKIAARTSPTNIAMALLGNLVAYDFGYVSVGELLTRTAKTLETLEKLERYRGHLFNWYDTRTLRPLTPRYVSSVDSGNLAAALLTLRGGLAEIVSGTILPQRWREGIEDAAGVLLEEVTLAFKSAQRPDVLAVLEALRTRVNDVVQKVRQSDGSAYDIHQTLMACASVRGGAGDRSALPEEVVFWADALVKQCRSMAEDLLFMIPWIEGRTAGTTTGLGEKIDVDKTFQGPGATSLESLAAAYDRLVSEGKVAHRRVEGSVQELGTGEVYIKMSSERAAERVAQIQELMERCDELSELDLDFLYDSGRKLIAVGFNVDIRQRDPSSYDILASEARLLSFVAVARGLLPLEHWFHMGRTLAVGPGAPVLMSWSGSLFEYVMPLVIMPTFEGTLLDTSARAAVARQIQYGRAHNIPWGFSESGYNQVDAAMSYQYRAFGVPGLGLKRGLADDLVVAPYASALALVVRPRDACRNLETMARLGFVGRYGLYEAVDYTPARVPHDDHFAIVRSHMAHHSGMSLLAFVSLLCGEPVQRRFHADPEMRAAELLLQERVPLARGRGRSGTSASIGTARPVGTRDASVRSFNTAATATPEVHLLSNGRYHVMVTNAGSGFSRWKDLALTRWREDITRDNWGTFFYVKDVDSGDVWSSTYQPVCAPLAAYEVTFAQGLAEFRAVRSDVRIHTRHAVSPEDDVELRQLVVTNLSDRTRALELTSYAEIVLAHQRDEEMHPVFQGLFVETEIHAEKSAILVTRRPRSESERWPCLFHMFVVGHGGPGGPPSFETARDRFVGRTRDSSRPVALEQSGELSNTAGAVLDPIVAVRHGLRLAPGESVTLNSVTGIGEDRHEALLRVDKYLDTHLAERVFELAWTHSQVLLHQLRASENDAQLFARMAGSVLYADDRYRTTPGRIARNRRGQSALWSYGVSGDLPLVLVRISDETNMSLVRHMLQCHSYWRHKGLTADLMILAEAFSGYQQSLLDAIIGLVHASPEAKLLDQAGGIFVRNVDQVPEEDRLLIQAAARFVVHDHHGTLESRLERQGRQSVRKARHRRVRRPETLLPEETVVPERQLRFFNGLGGFTEDGREYVIILRPGVSSPAPWVNVLANAAGFGTVVTESGGSFTWAENAREYRLTPWHNDPVSDASGEAFYIRDEETGQFWSPTPLPARGPTPYVCRHGLGYTAFEHTQYGIFSEMMVCVAVDAPIKCVTFTLRNLSDRPRRLSLTGYCEWVLGDSRRRQAMHVVTALDLQTGALFARNAFNHDFTNRIAFFQCSQPGRTLTADRTEFIGRSGTLAMPEAMRRAALSNTVGPAFDPCAAIQAPVDILAGQETQIVFVLGAAQTAEEARGLLRQSSGQDGARQMLDAVWQFWKQQLGGIYVETPDRSVDYLVNHWLMYQVLTSRFWGRSGFYQSGGAYGFRDQLQDSLAFLYECPWLTRQHLLYCAGRQFPEGDVQHWWHPPMGRGIRTRISDDHVWLAYATCRYVQTTGDIGVLDEQVPFVQSRVLRPEEDSVFDLPRVTERKVTLYEHCVLGIRHALRFGSHGLPLMGGGDWNDAMDRVGREGRGESVWLAFLLYDVLSRFAPLAATRNDSDFAALARREARRLAEAIEAHAWDGQWYRRAFFDDGTPLGSAASTECQVDLLPQSWAVLSGAALPGRASMAMDAAFRRLVDDEARLIRLFAPPFDAAPCEPGYIKGYLPGVRENGGQYTHAAVWFVTALAELHRAGEAWRLFFYLNPIHHAEAADGLAIYKVEPYVMAADVYTTEGHNGRGGWTWYTGSAGWMYQLLVEKLLGLRLEVDKLAVEPIFHPEWTEYTVHYRYRNTLYHIHVKKVGPNTWDTSRLLVDGVEQPDKLIHLVDDQRERTVLAEVG